MMIYKEAGNKDSVVILETEGGVGAYNRANRSLTHFIENSLPVILCLALAGNIFPFPSFVLAAVFTGGRILHQLGYASPKGYGAHAPGFLLAFIATMALEGLCLFVALSNLGVGHARSEAKSEL